MIHIEKPRMDYLDNLRSWVMFLVVAMHSNVTYSGLGGWYYIEGKSTSLNALSMFIFGFYGCFTQAWFMGILFFLAAYFAARALAKMGPVAFLRERLFRLGVPLLIYVFMVHPFIGYFLMNYDGIRSTHTPLQAYLAYLVSFDWIGSTGPLWFAQALLFFCIAYTAVRAIRSSKDEGSGRLPSTLTIILVVLATGLAAFCIRLFFPIGSSVLNLQFSFFASYIALFILGAKIGEGNLLEALAEKYGVRCLALVAAVGIPLWTALMIGGGALRGNIPIEGGMHWQSFAYAFWEAAVAIGFSLGLIAFFRRYLNIRNGLTRFLAANAFGVYLLHAPVLVALSLFLKDWSASPLAKHAAVTPLAFALTLAFSALVRLIPVMRKILK